MRGDGKRYGFRLKTDASFDGVSYQVEITPPAGKWVEIAFPFGEFVPVYRGRVVRDHPPLDPSRIATFGLLISRQEGPFRIDIETIRAIAIRGRVVNASAGNPVNRKKLPNSKWTAVRPVHREKHFIVLDWVRDEDGTPTDHLVIEAVLTNRAREIHWRELENPQSWRVGWR